MSSSSAPHQSPEERDQILREIIEAADSSMSEISMLMFQSASPALEEIADALVPPYNSVDHARICYMLESKLASTRSSSKFADDEHRIHRVYRVPDASIFGQAYPAEPRLVLVNRETDEKTIVSADTTDNFIPVERSAGHRNFFRDLMTTVKYSGGIVKVISNESDFDAACPCPLMVYSGIIAFVKGASRILKPRGSVNLSAPERIQYLISVLEEMPIRDFLQLQSMFYVCVFGIKSDSKGLIIKSDMPLAFVFAQSEWKDKFPEITGRRNYIFRERGIKMTAVRPAKDIDLAAKVPSCRTWRGEDDSIYSSLTQHYNRGGNPAPLQVQVTQALSIILPAAEQNVTDLLLIRPASTETAKHLAMALTEREVGFKFHLSELAAEALRAQAHCDIPFLETCPRECLYVDLHGMRIPTVSKGVDLFEFWEKLHDSQIPRAQHWIALRKVFPLLIKSRPDLYFYGVNSSHAYDVIESNLDGLSKVVGVVQPDLSVTETIRPLYKLTPETHRSFQFSSNRKKTSLLQSTETFKVDEVLNLWEPPLELRKRDLRKVKVEVESLTAGQEAVRVSVTDIQDQIAPDVERKPRKEVKGKREVSRRTARGRSRSESRSPSPVRRRKGRDPSESPEPLARRKGHRKDRAKPEKPLPQKRNERRRYDSGEESMSEVEDDEGGGVVDDGAAL